MKIPGNPGQAPIIPSNPGEKYQEICENAAPKAPWGILGFRPPGNPGDQGPGPPKSVFICDLLLPIPFTFA